MTPILRDLPTELCSERLRLRAPRPGDGAAINAAVVESFASLQPWIPWARTLPSVTDSELYARESAAKFLRREDLPMVLESLETGALIGGIGLHRIDWEIPRFEIGYWLRTSCEGRGFMTEAVRTLADFAQLHLGARRLEIRVADANIRSWLVAERLGFTLDGILRHWYRSPTGDLVDLRIYSRVF